MSIKYPLWDVLWTPCDNVENLLQSSIGPNGGQSFSLFIGVILQGVININTIWYVNMSRMILSFQLITLKLILLTVTVIHLKVAICETRFTSFSRSNPLILMCYTKYSTSCLRVLTSFSFYR